MFRELLRIKQALSAEECLELLKTQPRGVLSVIGDNGYPYGMPMDHWYCEDDGKIYFHGGRKGHKIDALKTDSRASFCVMDDGTPSEDGWWLRFRSVIVFGRVEFIEDRERIFEISRRLSHKFTTDEGYIDYEIEHSGARTAMFALVPEHMTGKLVNEK